jgi:protein phosphatase
VAVLPESGLVVVADGMGGANAGDVASHTAVEIIVSHILSQDLRKGKRGDSVEEKLARAAVDEANRTIFASSLDNPQFEGMGTTVVLGLFLKQRLIHAHVGDSRLYRFREKRLECLTVDHSVIQELVNQGVFPSIDEARAAGVRNNVLTRALGIEETVQIDIDSTQTLPGDVYLFCTDGLTNMVDSETITRMVTGDLVGLDAVADGLIRLACEKGGNDNISLVLVRV